MYNDHMENIDNQNNPPTTEKLYIRPANKSLAAYKALILDMQEHLTGNRDDKLSEEEWVMYWEEFWGNEID